MFRKLYNMLIRIRDAKLLRDKIKVLTTLDELIYPWYNDPKN